MDGRELILDLGTEGGGAEVYRTPVDPGGWLFHVECSSIFLDDNLDEGWQDWSSEPLATIQEALEFVMEDGGWVRFHPSKIHPDYRQLLWGLVQEITPKMLKQDDHMWRRRYSDWEEQCLGRR